MKDNVRPMKLLTKSSFPQNFKEVKTWTYLQKSAAAKLLSMAQ